MNTNIPYFHDKYQSYKYENTTGKSAREMPKHWAKVLKIWIHTFCTNICTNDLFKIPLSWPKIPNDNLGVRRKYHYEWQTWQPEIVAFYTILSKICKSPTLRLVVDCLELFANWAPTNKMHSKCPPNLLQGQKYEKNEKEWYTDWAGPSIKQCFYHVGFRPFDFGSDNIVTLKRKCFLFFYLLPLLDCWLYDEKKQLVREFVVRITITLAE